MSCVAERNKPDTPGQARSSPDTDTAVGPQSRPSEQCNRYTAFPLEGPPSPPISAFRRDIGIGNSSSKTHEAVSNQKKSIKSALELVDMERTERRVFFFFSLTCVGASLNAVVSAMGAQSSTSYPLPSGSRANSGSSSGTQETSGAVHVVCPFSGSRGVSRTNQPCSIFRVS